MTIEARVAEFIQATKPVAIVISGKWGEGKTHFWHLMAKTWAEKAKKIRPNYAYVSLFGINSLAELRAALSGKVRPVERMNEDIFGALFESDFSKLGWKKRWQLLFGAGKNAAHTLATTGTSLPLVGNVGALYLAAVYHKVRGALICIDDIERRGDGLALRDVMGLISDLVTERDCSVVVILNDGALANDDPTVWAANREKVFSGELTFRATPRKCASYVFGDAPYEPNVDFAVRAISDLGIVNVRVIERIRAAMELVFDNIDDRIKDDTRVSIIRCLVLLVYSHMSHADGAPPISRIKRSYLADEVSRLAGTKKDERTDQEKAWDVTLEAYNFSFGGQLDEALEITVLQGYPDIESLKVAVKKFDQEVIHSHGLEQLRAAWHLFRENFSDNANEVIEAMTVAFEVNVESLDAENTAAIIQLMRKLSAEELAEKMVARWIDLRRGDRWRELAPRRVEVFEELRDLTFRDAIQIAYGEEKQSHAPTLGEIISNLNRPLDEEELQILMNVPVAGYASFIKINGGVEIRRLLQLQKNEDARSKIISNNVRDALLEIAAENPTNAVRIEWIYNIRSGNGAENMSKSRTTSDKTESLDD